MPQVIFPPRPKGRMNPKDLPFYEESGLWCAQRKFNGTRNLIHIEATGKVSVWGRHGEPHKKFSFNNTYRDELLSCLKLDKGVEYWLDSEVMNKQANATNEIILYDVLQVGRYFFGSPDQMQRLEILKGICGDPQDLEPGGLALRLTDRVWMAQTFPDHFVDRFNESLSNPKLEGLVLRKRKAALDHFGNVEYETGNLIRCRKPFAEDKGYNL
jgi:hypothetical protein